MPFHPCSLSFEPEAFCFISMHQMQPSLLYCDLASVATRVGDASRRRGIQSLWGPSTVQSTILNRALPTSAPRKFVVLLTLHRATHVEDRTHRATANEKGVDSCEMDVCRWIEQWSVYRPRVDRSLSCPWFSSGFPSATAADSDFTWVRLFIWVLAFSLSFVTDEKGSHSCWGAKINGEHWLPGEGDVAVSDDTLAQCSLFHLSLSYELRPTTTSWRQ